MLKRTHVPNKSFFLQVVPSICWCLRDKTNQKILKIWEVLKSITIKIGRNEIYKIFCDFEVLPFLYGICCDKWELFVELEIFWQGTNSIGNPFAHDVEEP